MNIKIVNPNSTAYKFGQRDAQANQPCVPEMIFVGRQEQVNYAAGYESVKGISEATRQFTGSELPQPAQVAHKTRSAGEYTRWTDLDANKVLKAEAARDRRIAKMAQMTREFLGGILADDIIFAA